MKYPILGVREFYPRTSSNDFGFVIYPLATQTAEHKINHNYFLAAVSEWSLVNFEEGFIFTYEKVRGEGTHFNRGIKFLTWIVRGCKIGVAWRVRTWGKGWRTDPDDNNDKAIHFMFTDMVEVIPISPKTQRFEGTEDDISPSPLKE